MKVKNLLMLSATIVMWGLAFPLVKLVLLEVPPLTLALLRSALASLFLLFHFRDSRVLKFTLHGWKAFSFLGLVGVTLYHTFQNMGQKFTTASNSSVIISSNPVFIALLSFLILKEKISLKRALGILLAFFGMVVIVLEDPLNPFTMTPKLMGDLLSLGAALSWAIYSVYGKRVLMKYDTKEATTNSIIFGTLFLLPMTLAFEKPVLPRSLWLWVPILILSILCSGVAYLFWYRVLEEVPASKVGIYLFLIPAISVLVSHQVFLESPSIFFGLGTTLILLGVLITERS